MYTKIVAIYPATASSGLANAIAVSVATTSGAGPQAMVCARRSRALSAGEVSLAMYAPYHHLEFRQFSMFSRWAKILSGLTLACEPSKCSHHQETQRA